MKVLMITWACDLEDVSEPSVAARWVTEISKDHDVTLIAVSRPDRYGCVQKQFPNLDVIEWCDIRVPKFLERFRAIVKPGYLPFYIRARRFLKRLVAEKKFDVIHHLSPFAWRYPSPATGLGVPVVRGPVAGGLKTPVALDRAASKRGAWFMPLRKTDDMRISYDPWLRASYMQADHVLLAAPYVAKLLARLPFRASSIEIEHGLADDESTEFELKQSDVGSKVRLLFVGRIIPTKGLRYALRALSIARMRKSIVFDVVGDGEDRAACELEVNSLGLADSVTFRGWQDRSQVERFYRAADVFVFPSFREPTGGVLLEAMRFGLPIITCAYGGPESMVEDSFGVKVFPESEDQFVSELAAGIDRLASDQKLRFSMGKTAAQVAEERYSWAAKRARVGAVYARLAEKSMVQS